MKNILLFSAFLLSSVSLMAQQQYFSGTKIGRNEGIDAYQTKISKGLVYSKTANAPFLGAPKITAVKPVMSDSKMKVYLPNSKSEITTYQPKNSEKLYLKIYNAN